HVTRPADFHEWPRSDGGDRGIDDVEEFDVRLRSDHQRPRWSERERDRIPELHRPIPLASEPPAERSIRRELPDLVALPIQDIDMACRIDGQVDDQAEGGRGL